MFKAIVDVMMIFAGATILLSPAFLLAGLVENDLRGRKRTKGDYCRNDYKK